MPVAHQNVGIAHQNVGIAHQNVGILDEIISFQHAFILIHVLILLTLVHIHSVQLLLSLFQESRRRP